MIQRTHGGVAVSEIGVGAYSLSGGYGRKDVVEFKRMVGRAHELGVNFFDVADGYGDAERILGEALAPFREDVIIATKVGLREGATPNLSYDYISDACEKSLHRLNTDHIDLYQVHFDDPGTPVEESVEALERLVDEGKILHYGVGHLPEERIREYCSKGNVFSVLMELSAVSRTAETTLLPSCREFGAAAIAFSTTGRGILTGAFDDGLSLEKEDIRRIDSLFHRESFESATRIAERFREVGESHDRTTAQVAISWVLSHEDVVCALTGPSTVPHLEENLGASGWSIPRTDMETLGEMLQKEEDWLRDRRLASLTEILNKALPTDRDDSVRDLVHVMETAATAGCAREHELMPLFAELFELKERGKEDVSVGLEVIQRRLTELLKPR